MRQKLRKVKRRQLPGVEHFPLFSPSFFISSVRQDALSITRHVPSTYSHSTNANTLPKSSRAQQAHGLASDQERR